MAPAAGTTSPGSCKKPQAPPTPRKRRLPRRVRRHARGHGIGRRSQPSPCPQRREPGKAAAASRPMITTDASLTGSTKGTGAPTSAAPSPPPSWRRRPTATMARMWSMPNSGCERPAAKEPCRPGSRWAKAGYAITRAQSNTMVVASCLIMVVVLQGSFFSGCLAGRRAAFGLEHAFRGCRIFRQQACRPYRPGV